jgi:hypothetical protein
MLAPDLFTVFLERAYDKIGGQYILPTRNIEQQWWAIHLAHPTLWKPYVPISCGN